ncbi:sugar phosphate isomerase/epimerase family protein [bacterium]
MNRQTRFRFPFLCVIFILVGYFLLCSQNKDAFNPAIGVCTSISNAALIRSHGFDYIEEGVQRFLVPLESDAVFHEKLQDSKACGLEISACNSFLPGKLKCVGPDARHSDILRYAETAFSRARSGGVKIIVFGSGSSRRIPDGFSKEEAERQFISLLKKMGPIAGEFGIIIAIEPLRRAETNFIQTVIEGLDIVQTVNHPNIRLLADFYHMMQEEEGPEAILKAGDYLRHCHIAEKEKRTPPGNQGDDFRPYLRALKQIDYKGGISIECRWEDMESQLSGAIAELKRQIRSLE